MSDMTPEDEKNLEPELTSEPEPAAEPVVKKARQWVTLRGSSMDLRVGQGIVGEVAHDLRSIIGRPHACALLHAPDADARALEDLRRDLCDQGFEVHVYEMPSGEESLVLASVEKVAAFLADSGVTSDDLVVAMGHAPELSVAAFACQHWCGGVPLAIVPCDLVSALTAGVTPRWLSVDGHERMVSQDGSARFEVCDLALFDLDPNGEDYRLARSIMVATAMADVEKSVSELWDRSEALLAGDLDALIDQIVLTVRGRGKIVASTSVAVRQSIDYGRTFGFALKSLVGDAEPDSVLLADGMRFAARVSAASESLTIDDMFTQDELLERLGIPTSKTQVDPEALLEAVRAERFARTNRFMLEIPRALGRVRLSNVEIDLLREHVSAWCAARGQEA